MRDFLLWFVKVTGILPFLIWYKPHKYYEGGKPKPLAGEIIIANHTTLMDFAMMLYIYPFHIIRVLMGEVLFRTSLCAWFMHQLKGIRVNRDAPENTDKLQEAIQTLENGGITGVFPEGRLNKCGQHFGQLLPFNPGAAYLALKTGAKVRPVYFRVQGGLFRSSQIMVGEPIDLRAMFGCSTERENLMNATKYLKQKMEQLREELRFSAEHREHSLSTRFIKWSAGVGMRIAFRIRVHFEDPEQKSTILGRASIIACNHTSVFDPPMLCTVFKHDKLHILACETLYEYPMLSRLLKRLGCIKIDRNILDVESFHLMQSVLEKHECVGIFPEGKLSTDGTLGEFKPGTILAAVTSEADVIPVYMTGTAKAFSRRGRDVWIGRPVRLTGTLSNEDIAKGTTILYNAIANLKKMAEES